MLGSDGEEAENADQMTAPKMWWGLGMLRWAELPKGLLLLVGGGNPAPWDHQINNAALTGG